MTTDELLTTIERFFFEDDIGDEEFTQLANKMGTDSYGKMKRLAGLVRAANHVVEEVRKLGTPIPRALYDALMSYVTLYGEDYKTLYGWANRGTGAHSVELTTQEDQMALETLKNVTEIGGFKVTRDPDSRYDETFVGVFDEDNVIGFKLQNGPIKEVGVNGCQVDTLIHAAAAIIEGFNAKFPCKENLLALQRLNEALDCLEERKRNREQRGVEGTSQV